MNNGVIVFAPHQDDETLACGGTIAKRIDENNEVFVVFMTDGRYGLQGITSSSPSQEELAKIRKEEAINAMAVLGVKSSNLFFLGNEDAHLELCESEAENSVIRILEEISPCEVYFPSENDVHVDHLATNKIVSDSLTKLDYSKNTYEYSIWLKHIYFDLVAESIINLTKHYFTYVDVSKYLNLKRMALEQYRSQFSIISPQQKAPVFSSSFMNRFLKNKEKYLNSRKYMDDM